MDWPSKKYVYSYAMVSNATCGQLRDQQTGKYLDNLSASPYDPNSTSNPHGQYGSKYSPDSINQ